MDVVYVFMYETFGIENVEVKNQDIKEGIGEDNIDLVFLDLPKPYEIFEDVHDALNLGGWLVVYAPYINQAEISYRVAKKLGFFDIEITELLERGLEVRQNGVRPKTRMVGHSGYLLFARNTEFFFLLTMRTVRILHLPTKKCTPLLWVLICAVTRRTRPSPF